MNACRSARISLIESDICSGLNAFYPLVRVSFASLARQLRNVLVGYLSLLTFRQPTLNTFLEKMMKLNQHNRIATPFGDIQIDMENLVEQLFGDRAKKYQAASSTSGFNPVVEVTEQDSSYQVVVELAGVNPADVNVEMEETRLEISGEKKAVQLEEGVTSLKQERLTGTFKRVFEFAKQVEPDQIKAEFKDGLLTILLPKSKKVLPRKIKIDLGQ